MKTLEEAAAHFLSVGVDFARIVEVRGWLQVMDGVQLVDDSRIPGLVAYETSCFICPSGDRWFLDLGYVPGPENQEDYMYDDLDACVEEAERYIRTGIDWARG